MEGSEHGGERGGGRAQIQRGEFQGGRFSGTLWGKKFARQQEVGRIDFIITDDNAEPSDTKTKEFLQIKNIVENTASTRNIVFILTKIVRC